MKIAWSAPALEHLVAIHDYLSQQASPYTAAQFLRRLLADVDRLERFPRVGRVVPESGGDHRELIFRPYRIVYRVESEQVLVVAVIHGSREFSVALSESLSELSRDRKDENPS